MGYKVITAAPPVVTLEDARLFLRLNLYGQITHPDDSLILALIDAAREYCEHYTQRSIGVQTLEIALDAFPNGAVKLTLGAESIVSVKYTDGSGIVQTVNPVDYQLDDYSYASWMTGINAWPSTSSVVNAVLIRYTTPAYVSFAVRAAVLLMLGHLYENRSAVNMERGINPAVMPLGVKALLDTQKDYS